MYWTLELASYLEDAPWPASKDELVDYALRSAAPLEVVENLQEIEDEGEVYETIEDIWPDYPTKEDFFFNEDEYWPNSNFYRQPLHKGRLFCVDLAANHLGVQFWIYFPLQYKGIKDYFCNPSKILHQQCSNR